MSFLQSLELSPRAPCVMQNCGPGEAQIHLPCVSSGGDTSAWGCRASAAFAAFQGGLLQHWGCSLPTQAHLCSLAWRSLPHWCRFPLVPCNKVGMDTVLHCLPATLIEDAGTFPCCPRDLSSLPTPNKCPHPQAARWIINQAWLRQMLKNRVIPAIFCASWCQVAWKSSAGVGECFRWDKQWRALPCNLVPRNRLGLGSAAATTCVEALASGPWSACLALSRWCSVIKESVWDLVTEFLAFSISELQKFDKHPALEELPHGKSDKFHKCHKSVPQCYTKE